MCHFSNTRGLDGDVLAARRITSPVAHWPVAAVASVISTAISWSINRAIRGAISNSRILSHSHSHSESHIHSGNRDTIHGHSHKSCRSSCNTCCQGKWIQVGCKRMFLKCVCRLLAMDLYILPVIGRAYHSFPDIDNKYASNHYTPVTGDNQ